MSTKGSLTYWAWGPWRYHRYHETIDDTVRVSVGYLWKSPPKPARFFGISEMVVGRMSRHGGRARAGL